MAENLHYGLDYDTFFRIIDNLYDEIWVYDNNYKIIYVNKACKRHYGFEPQHIIGKTFFELRDDNWWSPSILPHVYKEKKIYAVKQNTFLGSELINIAKPIFDEEGNIEMVAMSVRDELEGNKLFHSMYSEEDLLKMPNNHIIHQSSIMQQVMKLAKKISKIDATCLITGESGTGKTMIARYIHNISERKDKPFVSINCSSIPTELLESELFGYIGGAFTGAKADGKIGLFKSANGGTVLLDEIAEMPYNLQAKILEVIQEKKFYPVGSVKSQTVDIKIISATNKNLHSLCKAGAFREDLFYRLNTFEIFMPALRERKDDIEKLIYYFLNLYSNKYSMHHEISYNAVEILKHYMWKGNIRELEHLMERLVVTVEDILIDKKDLPSKIFEYSSEIRSEDFLSTSSTYKELIDNYEYKIVNEAYEKYKTTRAVAKELSISQTKASTLLRKHIKEKSDII